MSPAEKQHDVVAIGCGPFNLGLVALASTLPDLDLVAFDASPDLRWHSGLMFPDARLQLSFLADLVSMVEPTHPLSFLAYLRDVDRLYPFYIREEFHPTRREYEDYLRWAAARLSAVRWGHRVDAVGWDAARGLFTVDVTRTDGPATRVLARDLVIGIGTEPSLPPALAALAPRATDRVLHSARYLHRQAELRRARHVTVVGAGQSGAEVTLDLLRHNLEGGPAVSWLTRTRSFAPLDYTKLVLEMTTPAYVRYFHGLPQAVKDRLVAEQWQHYKGISTDTLESIHDVLYQRELEAGLRPVELRYGITVEAASVRTNGDLVLSCRHADSGAVFEHVCEWVVAATGYRERRPAFLTPLESFIARDDKGRVRVRLDHAIELAPSISGRIFVSHADLHSHGVAAPDLGVAAFRNASILNAILGREAYRLPRRTAFTTFAPPGGGAGDTADDAAVTAESMSLSATATSELDATAEATRLS